MQAYNNPDIITEEMKQKLSEKFIDLTAMYYISLFMWSMEHDLADNRGYLKAVSSALQINETLLSESYWENVWGDKGNDDKYQKEKENLKNLNKKLPKLFALLALN